MDPVATTRALYEAFGRGDVAAILARLAPDVEWEYGIVSHDVPWYQARHGKDQISGFFESLTHVQFQRFEPKLFLGEGDTVVVLLDADYEVKATGRHVVYEDAVMIWKFDAEGRVARFAHRVDTHQAWLALRA